MNMKNRWQELLKRLQADTDAGDKVYQMIIWQYTGPQRFYHNLQHLAACLVLLDRVSDRLTDAAAVEYALWFHDMIYNAQSQANEELSAVIARHYALELAGDTALADTVYQLILATRHRANQTLCPDAQYLADIDLAILATDSTTFSHYEANIRKEYGFMPDAEYQLGRIKVLSDFLERPVIFQTPYFRSLFEATARQNMTWLKCKLTGEDC